LGGITDVAEKRTGVLDPNDWNAFRALSHRALDDALDSLEQIGDYPAWREMPDDVRERVYEPLPREPTPIEDVYRQFVTSIMPYHGGNIHPRFFGWVQGSGTPTGALADLLASTMNPNVGGRNHGAVHVERAVVRWFCELFGFPQAASGVLTVGTSTANLIAVLVARTKTLGTKVRETGIDVSHGRLMGYASSATHGCIRRAFEVSGLGSSSLRVLSCDTRHRADPAAVRAAIAEDRAAGHRPFLIVGNAGTVDVGAIDPLDELADLAQREGVWYHVDGAFGALAMMSEELAPRLRGIERADSLAFDAHKWLHVPYDAGCLLVREAGMHRATFASTPSYLTRMPRGLADAEPWFTDFTIDLSRSFRALKLWFTIKEHGTRKLGEAIEANVRQARMLGDMIDADAEFELLAPVQLNVVCFRYCGKRLGEAELDRFNDELVIRLQESGDAVTSSTTISGKRAIRVCIVNQRTTEDDLVILVDSLRRIAREMR
jgi:aromatic-L-amino-acid decarboxylase